MFNFIILVNYDHLFDKLTLIIMNLYYLFVEETSFVVVIKLVDKFVFVVVVEEAYSYFGKVYSYFVKAYSYSVDKNSSFHLDKNIIVAEV